MSHRIDVLSWDEYFMSMAHLSAKRSKDPNTQVGACIVNKDKRVVGPVSSDKISICGSCRIECDFKQHSEFRRMYDLCFFISL